MTSTDIAVMNAAEARTITDRIKTGVDVIWELITRAYIERAWDALGYTSWDDYCTREFGSGRLRLPREERAEVVSSLREQGLSIRAIASATGDSIGTVHDALHSGVQNRTPDDGAAADALAEELIAAPPPIIGTDGKAYQPPAPKPAPKPVWSAEEEDIRNRIQSGETVVVSLRGLHANLIAWAEAQGLYVRIDRRTVWGNPFEMPDDGDRPTVISAYEHHYLPFKPSLMNQIDSLRGMALGCWCAPEQCHGDALVRYLNR